jgi:hypothetical protein
MRFVFVDPESHQENALREARLGALDALWREHTGTGRASRDRIEARLQELEPDLGLEWIDASDAGSDAVALEVSEPHLQPLASATAARNSDLPGLQIHAYRPCASLESALDDVRQGSGFDLSRARFRAGFGRGHLLDLVVYHADFSSSVDSAALAAAERLIGLCLGEQKRSHWVADVAVAGLPRGKLPVVGSDEGTARSLPIADLVPTVDAAITALHAGLAEVPMALVDPSDDWVMFELEPASEDGAAGKDDLVLASTRLPELTKAFVEDLPFSSERFSRHGEVFCYLKYEGGHRAAAEQHAALAALEDALAQALQLGRLGAVIGSGLGVRHSYVDLALGAGQSAAGGDRTLAGQSAAGGDRTLAVQPALDTLRRVAADVKLPQKCWLLFCDSEWRAEWVPLMPEGPPPPGIEAL